MPNPPSFRDLSRIKQQKNHSSATRFKASAIGGSRAAPVIAPSAPNNDIQFYSLVDSLNQIPGYEVTLPVESTYTVSYIKLELQAFNFYYRIDQLGLTNNPNLTCYRGTNYRFVHSQAVHPFALRASSGDTTTEISGTFNNDPNAGIMNDVVYFTPDENTPDSIVYQCTVHASMIGTITILDY
jgi:hypothetical protein|tara:strand:- start:25 stop:573 length:549 start_codon:yes stop_codon:yes gene_type:complete